MKDKYKKIVFFTYVDKTNCNNIKEGGYARFLGLYKYINQLDLIKKYININAKNNKIVNILKIFTNLIFLNKCIIVMEYPGLGLPIFSTKNIAFLLRRYFLKLLKYSSEKNKIYIDVADLPYEQAIDLELNRNYNADIFNNIEKRLFSLKNSTYIFASYSMRDYVCNKYNLINSQTIVCVNGGHELKAFNSNKYDKFIQHDKVNCIYAGTLNKGRQIETVIDIFEKVTNCNFILIGINGEWIEKSLYKNIQYLGALEETEAHQLVSLCDIGIIPYDSNRFYYNIAYPTKLSFYITAGITFLSTRVKEIENIKQKYDIGYTLDTDKWGSFINNISKKELEKQKEKINLVRSTFYWKNVFKIVNIV